jgi:hypothetical protein
MSKVFGGSAAAAQAAPARSPASAFSKSSPAPAASTASPASAPAPAAPAGSPAPVAEIDVTSILDGMAANNSEKLDWRHSIVDLMKLVGMDSSLSARKELANDLEYSGDMGDSASMNIWLHKEVLKRFAENGGKIPADLLG